MTTFVLTSPQATYPITGTWTATVTLQRSIDGPTTGFTDVATWTSNATSSYNDGLTNSIVWYRLGIKTGGYGSGTAVLALTYTGGGAAGVARVTGMLDRLFDAYRSDRYRVSPLLRQLQWK